MVYKLQKQYRLPGYDYSRSGVYFVTICTKDRECYFGEIVDDKVVLSETGRIAKNFWLEIPDRFENVILDAWVIMPNHVHGILVIDKNEELSNNGDQIEPDGGNAPYHRNAPMVGTSIRWLKFHIVHNQSFQGQCKTVLQ